MCCWYVVCCVLVFVVLRCDVMCWVDLVLVRLACSVSFRVVVCCVCLVVCVVVFVCSVCMLMSIGSLRFVVWC